MKPPAHDASSESKEFSFETPGPSVMDHLCDRSLPSQFISENENDDPEVNLVQLNGTWMPDLSLRYPPTFSNKVLF